MTVPPRADLIQPMIEELQRRAQSGEPIGVKELGRLSGVDASKISKLLNRKTGDRLVTIERLYAALGLEVRRAKGTRK